MATVVAVGVAVSGCVGPFNLTRRLYRWNQQVGTTWEQEMMFVLLAWTPVYAVSVLGDALVFNAMEFWTGDNPVDPPRAEAPVRQTRRIIRGHDEVLLTYTRTPDNAELLVEQFQAGEPAGVLRITQRDGVTVGCDAEGRVLFQAQVRSDGRALITDGEGRRVTIDPAESAGRFASRGRL
jgi:hypothetical protein